MFLYILNLLQDGCNKKNKIYNQPSAFEIINDTMYISQLAGIKKTADFKSINDKIVDIFEILNKYNLTGNDSIAILNKLIKNKNYSWILENIYNHKFNNKKEGFELAANSTINNILEKIQKEIWISENKSYSIIDKQHRTNERLLCTIS